MPIGMLKCSVCGNIGEETGSIVWPGVAEGGIITGLDPDNCEGCKQLFTSNGLVRIDINELQNRAPHALIIPTKLH